LGGAKHVFALEHLADSVLMLELRRYRFLNLRPWQPRGQYRQGIVQIDHGVDSASEEIHWLHTKSLRK
jgi:hypothetical protein